MFPIFPPCLLSPSRPEQRQQRRQQLCRTLRLIKPQFVAGEDAGEGRVEESSSSLGASVRKLAMCCRNDSCRSSTSALRPTENPHRAASVSAMLNPSGWCLDANPHASTRMCPALLPLFSLTVSAKKQRKPRTQLHCFQVKMRSLGSGGAFKFAANRPG